MFYNETVEKLRKELYHNQSQTDRVIKARHYIDQNLDESISLHDIAQACFSSPFHLNREFRRHYGITPAHYLKDRRIEAAKKALSLPGNVSGVCYQVGYKSLGSFSSWFRKQTGFSPAAMKKARMKK